MLYSLGPDFDADDMCLTFNTEDDHASPSDKIPISIPVYIIAPYFQTEPYRGPSLFRTREEHPVDERDTIESLLSGLFTSVVRDTSSSEEVMTSVLKHESPRESVVLVTTYRGRFLVIPRQT